MNEDKEHVLFELADVNTPLPQVEFISNESTMSIIKRIYEGIKGAEGDTFSWPALMNCILRTEYFQSAKDYTDNSFDPICELSSSGIVAPEQILVLLEEDRTDRAFSTDSVGLTAMWNTLRNAEGVFLFDDTARWMAHACQDFSSLGIWQSGCPR